VLILDFPPESTELAWPQITQGFSFGLVIFLNLLRFAAQPRSSPLRVIILSSLRLLFSAGLSAGLHHCSVFVWQASVPFGYCVWIQVFTLSCS
jgi:hypothetical protein